MSLFSKRLKELRTQYNLSQPQLAKILSVDQRSVSSWETGINETDFDTLIKIAKHFDVSIDYLLGKED